MRQRDIFAFWFPLFASWLLMATEGPIISAAINRLPNQVLMLAAYGIAFSLAVTIESPIINLLATTTTLAQDRAAFLLIRRFALQLIAVLTAMALLVGHTGLFDVIVIGWMQVPADVAAWVRMGLRVMVLWSAAIGWRRLWQGLLIRFNQTRKIGWGTLVRLVASGGSAIALAVWSRWPGVVIGATALMAGVLAEALYATWAAAPLLKHELGPASAPADRAPLTYGELFWFHLPLAGTSVLMLLVQPLVVASLTRLEHPVESLAAWPLVFQATLIARSPAMALPEVVIALTRGAESLGPVRRFALALAAASTALFAAFAFTPLASLYFARVQAASPEVAELARGGIVFFLGLPGLTILIAWLRGLLIKTRATKIVNAGMLVNLLVTVGVLALGVARNWPGLASAAMALNAAFVAELALLWWSTQRSIREIETAPN